MKWNCSAGVESLINRFPFGNHSEGVVLLLMGLVNDLDVFSLTQETCKYSPNIRTDESDFLQNVADLYIVLYSSLVFRGDLAASLACGPRYARRMFALIHFTRALVWTSGFLEF